MGAKKTIKKRLTPDQLDANYKEFIKGKELIANGKNKFDSLLKKAIKPLKNSSK